MPAFFVLSCRRQGPDYPLPPEIQKRDSCLTIIKFEPTQIPAGRVDLFIYDAAGTQSLECHKVFTDIPDNIGIVTAEGEKIVVALANCPRAPGMASTGRYDSLGQLGYGFEEDDPDRPVMSGTVRTEGNKCEIRLEAMMCTVELAAISNTMDGYELVENPKIRLLNINGRANIMQTEDFYPTETIDHGDWVRLPHDIGYYTQYPGTLLHCYPNDASPKELGSYPTTLELSCRIKGVERTFRLPLSPFGRNARILVELHIDGPDSFRGETEIICN